MMALAWRKQGDELWPGALLLFAYPFASLQFEKRKMQHYATASVIWATSMTVRSGILVGSNGRDPREQLTAIYFPALYELYHEKYVPTETASNQFIPISVDTIKCLKSQCHNIKEISRSIDSNLKSPNPCNSYSIWNNHFIFLRKLIDTGSMP